MVKKGREKEMNDNIPIKVKAVSLFLTLGSGLSAFAVFVGVFSFGLICIFTSVDDIPRFFSNLGFLFLVSSFMAFITALLVRIFR